MSELSIDDKRVKQLEDARRRVEELKKKNKKKGKKGKKTEDENDSSQVATADEAMPELEQESSPVSAPMEESVNPNKLDAKEPEASIKEKQPEKEVSKEEEVIKPEEKSTELEKDQSDNSKSKVEEKSIPPTKDQFGDKDSEVAEESLSKQHDVQDLFQNTESSDFLGTIQKQKEDDNLQIVTSQLEKVTAELKKLKFVNIEQETTIDELNQQVGILQTQLQSSQQELETSRKELQRFQQVTPKGPLIQSVPFSGSPQHQQKSPEYVPQQAHVDRTALEQWRNWNIDMTSWRSIGSGPIVEF
ncbi:hypothetical protein ZYGM_003364 [Zygosaccharomyces mellis]|uniref:Uncharacterized protein n=1 Tax=Zygosaccharomyces mellis TaxID=42258 RepID=A0A4C2E1V7_9SACH|nr:hypothetical protein ZYGM_003364 [Zygosaccharomyces mellis]